MLFSSWLRMRLGQLLTNSIYRTKVIDDHRDGALTSSWRTSARTCGLIHSRIGAV